MKIGGGSSSGPKIGGGPKFGGKKAGGGKFTYRPLTKELMDQRKNQSGSSRDPYVAPQVKMFSPGDGDNTLRLIPSFIEDADNPYGVEIHMHYGIGADRSSYLCPKAMKGNLCPICVERGKAEKGGDEEYAQALRTSKRVATWVIDRDKEGDGPKLWFMPFTLEREIAAQAVSKKSGAVLQFIDPDEGYDLTFTKKGKEKQTKYIGVSFDRDASPLSDDDDTKEEWLQYVKDNPVPDVLVFHDAKHISKQLNGGMAAETNEEDDDMAKKPTWASIHEMDADELNEFVTESGDKKLIKAWNNHDDFDSEEEAADWVCEQLGIEEEEEEDDAPAKGKKGGLKIGGKKGGSDKPTYKAIMKMDEEELTALAAEHEVDMDREFDDLEAAAKYLAKKLGVKEDDDGEEEEEEAPAKKKGGLKIGKGKKDAEEEEEEEEEAELPSWDEVHALSQKKLAALIEEHELDDSGEEFDDLEAAADWVCEQLEIEKPAKKKKGGLASLKG